MSGLTALRHLIQNHTYRISGPPPGTQCTCGGRAAIRVDGTSICQDCWHAHPASELLPAPSHACILDKDTMLTHVECWHSDADGFEAFYDALSELPEHAVLDALDSEIGDPWWRDFHQVCEAASHALAKDHGIPIPAESD